MSASVVLRKGEMPQAVRFVRAGIGSVVLGSGPREGRRGAAARAKEELGAVRIEVLFGSKRQPLVRVPEGEMETSWVERIDSGGKMVP